jgi:hypothetical protein
MGSEAVMTTATAPPPATTQLLVTVPFSGFHEGTIHDLAIDEAIDRMFEDINGNPIPGLNEKFWDDMDIDFKIVRDAYAKDYVSSLATELKVSLVYESISSPQYYNFTTDRIFAHLPSDRLTLLINTAGWQRIDRLIHDTFTSVPGFCSGYPNHRSKWPEDVSEWDHNQIGVLLEAATEAIGFSEDNCAAELVASDEIANWIWEAAGPKAERLFKIASYLRTRQERA